MGMCRIYGLAPLHCLRAAAFLLLLGMSLLVQAQAARAHAVLVSSTPAQGERLRFSPKVLSLRFSESVTQVAATLVSRNGRSIALTAKVSGNEVIVDLAKPLPTGAYAFSWRVVSEDGHPIAAALVFAVGRDANLAGFFGESARVGWLDSLTLGTKFVFYAVCLFGVGGTFFSIWIARSAPGSSTSILLFVCGVCAVLLLGLLGVEESGSSLGALAGTVPWTMAFQSSLARSMAVVGLSLLFAFAAGLRTSGRKGLSIISLLLLGPAFALTGHASGAGVRWLSFTAVSVHVIAVCFWAGALPGLWRVLGPDRAGQRQALSRFSSAIPLSIALMLVAGGYLAYVQVGTPAALVSTTYGNVLAVKIALVMIALGLGAWNRMFLTSRVEEGSVSAAKTMKTVVSFEILLIVLVLAATSLWRFTPPPRALALRPAVASIHIHDAAAMATVSFKTKTDLSFDVELSLETGDFEPLDPHEVNFWMSAADGSIAPFEVPVHRVSPGLWSAEHFQAPCDCQWKIRIDVLVSDFDMVTLNGSVKLMSAE
jgi:copper transport protein